MSDSAQNNNNNNDTSQQNEPSQYSGQYHSVKGTVVESIGDLTGSDSWRKSGREEHNQGELETKQARAKGYAEGIMDQAQGKYDAVAGAIFDDKSRQASGNAQHDTGKAKQELYQ